MTAAPTSIGRVVLVLAEDTYHEPLAVLAREVLGTPLGAEVRTERLDRAFFWSSTKLRAKVWRAKRQFETEGLELVRADGFVDSEGSPGRGNALAQVEQEVNAPRTCAHPAPCLVRLHLLKPTQEGLLLRAPGALLDASQRAVVGLGGEANLVSGVRRATLDARKTLAAIGKRPTAKVEILTLFRNLFCGMGKGFYMPVIAESPRLTRAAFQPEPACMKSLLP